MKETRRFVFNNESQWEAYSKEYMKKEYPNMGYTISGEVTKRKKKNSLFELENNDGEVLCVQPSQTYKKPFYKIYGYIPDGEQDSFVEVRKSNMTSFIICLFMLLAVLGTILFFVFNYDKGPLLDGNAKAYKAKIERPEGWDDSKILVPGFDTLYMDAGNDELYVALANPEENPCYFQFEVIMADTEETLFKTGYIAPGQAVTTLKLPRQMEAGQYDVKIKIKTYSIEDYKSELNGAVLETKLIVLR